MRNKAFAFLLGGLPALALVALMAVNCTTHSSPRASKAAPIPVIFDADIGDDIDDTWALGFLLRCPELDVKLVVGDRGKAQYRAKLLAKFLQEVGRTDVAVGVGLDIAPKKGSRQAEWIKDYELKSYPGKVHDDGVQAIIDTIMKSPRPVTLICVGPLQNIGEALRREPRIAQRARFVGMHGSVHKNATAEYNVKMDPKSCQMAFTAPWDVTITPLNTCGKVVLTGDKYQRVYNSKDPIASAIITNYRLWAIDRRDDSPAAVPIRSSTLFDTVAVYLAFNQALCGMEQLGIRVADDGAMVVEPDAKRLNVAMTWKDLGAFEDLLVERLTNGK